MDKQKKSLLLNWILLVIYSAINISTIYSLSHSWPNQGSFLWFLLVFFCPPFLYHFISISYGLALQKDFRWKKSLRLATFIAGFLLAGSLLQYAQRSSLRKFNRAYQPLIERVKQKMPTPCDELYFQTAKVRTYNHRINRMVSRQGKPIGELLYNEQRFIIHFLGGSIDIDGSTVFYDSDIGEWQLFHNDDMQKMDNLNFRQLGLTKCEAFLNENRDSEKT